MKKLKVLTASVLMLSMYVVIFTQRVLADMPAPDGEEYHRTSRPTPIVNGTTEISESKPFFELIEPIHILLGVVVVLVVIGALFAIRKMRKK